MAYIEGEQRSQHTLFLTTLDEVIPQDHVCRVIRSSPAAATKIRGLSVPVHPHACDESLVQVCRIPHASDASVCVFLRPKHSS
jgi:hypothetical protein